MGEEPGEAAARRARAQQAATSAEVPPAFSVSGRAWLARGL